MVKHIAEQVVLRVFNEELLTYDAVIYIRGGLATPQLLVTPTDLNCGQQELGVTSRKSIVVRNCGIGPLYFRARLVVPKSMRREVLRLGGSVPIEDNVQAGPFQLAKLPPEASNTSVTTQPVPLNPGHLFSPLEKDEELRLFVLFCPEVEMEYKCTLNVQTMTKGGELKKKPSDRITSGSSRRKAANPA